jgi:hypothetical protein
MKTAAMLILVLSSLLHAAAPLGWNEHAKQFMFAPAFDFKPVEGAKEYRITIEFGEGQNLKFVAKSPSASLSPVWDDVPVGNVTVKVESLDPPQVVGTRSFYRAAPFKMKRGTPVIAYDESARVALASVVNEPFVQSWRTSGKPDASYDLYRYASKIIGGGVISGCSLYVQLKPRPKDADVAIEIARRAADYLSSISAPADSPLAFMPPTYHDAKPTERENDQWTMMMTPAEAGEAYLDLCDASSDHKYLDAAQRIAASYAKLQLPSGTWYLKVDNTTGKPVAPNLLIPTSVIRFLDRLSREFLVKDYDTTLQRAVGWTMENPAKTFDWSAQFDDAKVREPYQNLSKHEACQFAMYRFAQKPADGNRDLEIELVRFAEDQFVVWEQPPPFPPRKGLEQLDSKHWITPCSLEQYAMFEPVSGSSAWMIMTYLSAYRATGETEYKLKAIALADALTIAQQKQGNGRYPTRMIEQDMKYWLNSTVNCARAMEMLSEAR